VNIHRRFARSDVGTGEKWAKRPVNLEEKSCPTHSPAFQAFSAELVQRLAARSPGRTPRDRPLAAVSGFAERNRAERAAWRARIGAAARRPPAPDRAGNTYVEERPRI
jgi:hypothetical protein